MEFLKTVRTVLLKRSWGVFPADNLEVTLLRSSVEGTSIVLIRKSSAAEKQHETVGNTTAELLKERL